MRVPAVGVVLLLLVAAPAIAPRAQAAEPEASIVEIAQSAGAFDTLIAALEATGLDEALSGEGPFTVFAPTDAAFGKLLEELGITAEDLLANPDLSSILLYHVAGGSLGASDLAGVTAVETLQGSDVKVTVKWPWWPRFRRIYVNDARVIQADILASNGVIHVIDEVLLPPRDIVSVADAAGSFTTLLAALEAAGLQEALSGEGPITVFAPTDEAFGNLLDELGITAEELLASPELSQILLYHVVSGMVLERDIVRLNLRSAETLQGSDVTISVRWPWFPFLRRIKVNDANVVQTDVLASNGVIHVIDKVLIPPQNLVETAAAAGNFTVLLAALEAAGLDGTLADEGPFTVLAPTDAAFADLLDELGVTAEELLASPDLAQILLYHVLAGEVPEADLVRLRSAETLEGSEVEIRVKWAWSPRFRRIFVNDSRVIQTDILASNGVIHVLDKVLIPSTD